MQVVACRRADHQELVAAVADRAHARDRGERLAERGEDVVTEILSVQVVERAKPNQIHERELHRGTRERRDGAEELAELEEVPEARELGLAIAVRRVDVRPTEARGERQRERLEELQHLVRDPRRVGAERAPEPVLALTIEQEPRDPRAVEVRIEAHEHRGDHRGGQHVGRSLHGVRPPAVVATRVREPRDLVREQRKVQPEVEQRAREHRGRRRERLAHERETHALHGRPRMLHRVRGRERDRERLEPREHVR